MPTRRSKANAIPSHAIGGFTSASSLLRDSHGALEEGSVTAISTIKKDIQTSIEVERVKEGSEAVTVAPKKRRNPVQTTIKKTKVTKILSPSVDSVYSKAKSKTVPRREDWTPVKDTDSSFVQIEDEDSTPKTAMQASKTAPDFGTLLGNYGYSHNASNSNATDTLRTSTGEAVTKRRKLEVWVNLCPSYYKANWTIARSYQKSSAH